MQTQHEQFLLKALELAAIRRGFCAPNPAVGALILKENRLIGAGYHQGCGHPHAEVEAFSHCQEDVRGATLYVTLEPCCHEGRTPPCTNLLIEKGIKSVIYGYADPDPRVKGKGHQMLEAAGIRCYHHPLPAIDNFYKSYQHWHATGQPWVTAKIALSIDGMIADEHGKPVAITGPQLSILTHQYRKQSDAILTTITTLLKDDPKLNVRLENEIYAKPVYVLDRELRIPLIAQVLKTASRVTVFHAPSADSTRKQLLESAGVKCHPVALEEEGLSLREVLSIIGQEGVHDLWVEAGGRCFESLLKQGLLQRALIYKSLLYIGKGAKKAFNSPLSELSAAKRVKWEVIEEDVVCDMAFTP